MLLVVCGHVAYYSDISISYFRFFDLSRMPLFFFISGFILYKNKQIWDVTNTIEFLSKKFIIQIIPTAIFLALYMFIFSLNTIDGKFNGYWFTITLFEFFVAYVLFNLFIMNKIACNTTLICFALFIYIFSYQAWCHNNYPFINDYFVCSFGFFIFFILGTIAKKHFNKVLFIFNHNIIMMAIISLMMIGSICFINGYFVHLEVRLLLSILGIFSIFYFFMKNGEYFDNSRIGKALQFIGRRTLDIYLLHYFFVNNSMSWIKNIGVESPTITFVISILTALVIIGICLLISKFLRTNTLLGKILFGAKVSTNEKG